jgi:hypothetical protein
MERQRSSSPELAVPQFLVSMITLLHDMNGTYPIPTPSAATLTHNHTYSQYRRGYLQVRLIYFYVYFCTIFKIFNCEYICRISADAARVGQLRVAVENGTFKTGQGWNTHEVACLLKLWLFELPDPIITNDL